jgi:hypothetical protein
MAGTCKCYFSVKKKVDVISFLFQNRAIKYVIRRHEPDHFTAHLGRNLVLLVGCEQQIRGSASTEKQKRWFAWVS